MVVRRLKKLFKENEVKIGDIKLEIIEKFKYLEVTINNNNDRSIEVD